MFSRDDEAIVALCTPRGHGAIALIRISGAGNAIAIVDSCAELSSGKKLESVPTHTIHHGFIVDSGKNIDEVLFLLTKAPKTFTGQDTVEITSHNNPFIIDKIIERLLQCGARVAGRGEFTKRAFLNGKVDLSQAEAVHELICAKSEAAVGSALAQLRGGLSHEMAELEKQILRLVTFAEASFEFGEEEISDVGHDEELRSTFKELSEHVHKIQETFSCQRCVRDGVRVAIVGSVNAGKSTILNSLVGRERA
ncbi:tRNA uridine-5-carboxymethylaminomethyl(34) synthesis GTPase MnmE, partial [bacterium]|nr:tRNA uridine-5-carboxymethylaminomethyl(34) synthesis GTPase MnmE [bacterium]